MVAWADRIAYCCHDFEDAVDAAIVAPSDLPNAVADTVGRDRRSQLHGFITAMIESVAETGRVTMRPAEAEALAAFRAFNYERIYLRPESSRQAELVIRMLRELVEWLVTRPGAIGTGSPHPPGSDEALADAVRYVSGMTDRFAMRLATEHLGWRTDDLPVTI